MSRKNLFAIIASFVLAVALYSQTPSGDLISVPAPDAPDAKKEAVPAPAPNDPPPAGSGAVPPQNGDGTKKEEAKKEEKKDANKADPSSSSKSAPKDDNWWLPIIWWLLGVSAVLGVVWYFFLRKRGNHPVDTIEPADEAGEAAELPARFRPQPPAPPAAHHLIPLLFLLGVSALSSQAGTFSDIYPRIGVPGVGYNVTLKGDFSDVSQILFWGSTNTGASKWVHLNLDAPKCNSSEMVGRIEIPADMKPLSTLSLRLVNRSGGKMEYTGVFALGESTQVAIAKLGQYVAPTTSTPPTTPTVVNRTIYQTDAATKTKLTNVDDRLTKAEADIKVLNAWYPDVEDLEKAVAKDPERFRQLVAKYAPASAPATTVNLQPVMDRLTVVQNDQHKLAGQVNQITTRLGHVEDRLVMAENQTAENRETIAVVGAATITRSKKNVCQVFHRLIETAQIHADAKPPKGCDKK